MFFNSYSHSIQETNFMMIDIVILCPLAIEYNAVKKHINKWSDRTDGKFELPYELGQIYFGNKYFNIALFETGNTIGVLQTKTTQILFSLKPTYIFLVGIAAGIKDVEAGDLVIGTKAYGYEFGKETKEGFLARPESVHYSRKLIDIAKQLVREYHPKGFKVEFGAIASGNKVIDDDRNTLKLIKRSYNDTKALEMESIGFALAAKDTDTLFLNIRSISDKGINKDDKNQELASKNAADFTFKLIERLPNKKSKKVNRVLKVYYANKLLSLFSLRNLKTTNLIISDSFLSFKIESETIEISKIEKLEHLKMKGDFAKNWVKFELPDEREFYFSKKLMLPGLGNIFGGNKQLYKQLEKFLVND